ncbi:MAG: FadR family transcriptional regulator [Anaerolineales bacterium]|nr:FadR family transcriptional regulator [Anaerolineales bacterium]
MMILRERTSPEISEFLRYLASHEETQGSLPTLNELSRELGISVAGLREQLEVARALGLVEVRPRTGTRRLDYSFAPAIKQSLAYALALNQSHFEKYSELRNHIEAAYWDEAVTLLTEEDKRELQNLITRAFNKLSGNPVQVPHEEHRKLHLLIYSRLNNPFVTGLLEAYWDAYEAVGLNMYAGGMDYLEEVWGYHKTMVQSICNGNYTAGRKALITHIDLLANRP